MFIKNKQKKRLSFVDKMVLAGTGVSALFFYSQHPIVRLRIIVIIIMATLSLKFKKLAILLPYLAYKHFISLRR
ncbi:hypothetical protein LMG7974_01206 [Campylobacter majalis]|uniref:Uncharacterized protein n=1 Tax=Campylobacter majalis TaxID=2790656 RepID=A0ABM8Q7H5_9BACT|nr:hypothetical protein [Campylobacter majalis]CAD7288896.1 hypothetical protein LMG7974_01206 [Campylobacter majalis]